jgi:8-oxo-dGTP pyrophosphatase MutT (NUDIX family)
MMQHKIITRLSDSLQQPLPGWEAQKTMSPISSDRYINTPDNARRSAVMIFLSNDKDLTITYIKRASHPQDPHSGQIGFPGGSMEDRDASLLDTAIRESHEELGINRSSYKILGALSPLYVYVSNFFLQPYIAYSTTPLSYILQKSEVDEVIEIPFDEFYKNDIIKRKDYKVRSSLIENMPYYDLQPHVLWGATAMITAELIYLIKEL